MYRQAPYWTLMPIMRKAMWSYPHHLLMRAPGGRCLLSGFCPASKIFSINLLFHSFLSQFTSSGFFVRFPFCSLHFLFQDVCEANFFPHQKPVSFQDQALLNPFHGCNLVAKKLWQGWQKSFFALTSPSSGKLRPFFVNQTSFIRSEVFFYGENDEVNGVVIKKVKGTVC